MKNSKNKSDEKNSRFWSNITSGLKEKLNIKEKSISENENSIRDMGDTRTPFSRLDLTGLNRQQAKELIEKVIDERLEQISQIELTELKVDYKEKERQKAKAAERVSERRNRRKQKASASDETMLTEDGVFSNCKQISVFDIIQPESFPIEEESHPLEEESLPLEGQLSISEVLAEPEVGLPEALSCKSETELTEGFTFEAEAELAEALSLETEVELAETAGLETGGKTTEALGLEAELAPAASSQTEFGEIMSAQTEAITNPDQATGKKSKKKSKKRKENQQSFNTLPVEKGDEETSSLAVAAITMAASEVLADASDEETMVPAEITPAAADDETMTTVSDEVILTAEVVSATPNVNTSFDEAIDMIFGFYEKSKVQILRAGSIGCRVTNDVIHNKVIPPVLRFLSFIRIKTTPIMIGIDKKLGLTVTGQKAHRFLSKKEAVLSDKMAQFIELTDKGCDKIALLLYQIGSGTSRIYNQSKDFVETHKKKFLIGFGCTAAAAAAITITIGSMTAYEYVYNGKVLGVVKNQEDVYKTIDIIGDKLCYQYDAEITINKDEDIQFNKIVAFGQELDDKEDILNRLTYMRDMKANGHGIFVDGKVVAVLDSEETAKEILSAIQDTYLKQADNIQYKEVGFAENVTIDDVETKLGNIDARDKVLEYMMTGAVEKKIHQVQQGETFSGIAKTYGIKQSDLQVSNPNITPDKLQIGQEISLNQIVPLVTVQTVEVAEYIETIPFEITYENTASLFKKEQTVKSKGVNGEKDVVAEIVRNNGLEVSRKEISATILSEPVSQVVLVGTKDPPPLIGTGNLIYPIRGTLTSRYGTRWGRLHSGIDLAAPIGTKIKASDGGKVIFAGYNGSLGYMVKIDHGGGKVTLYGHCSKLFVKVGDRVYQGQHIANVGNTGRSTGPHVHFEVHINGNTKNPLNYL
ncbi:peptidoglycan DD-metalloendopeptidase family protein [Anoxybacterium hadale]|uniref:peptidoglycan DD-metalloendopeptidase family protein n=1 Tax=Anoxybacterium hadale TaxID=3408580 RepID=UPI003B001200